MVLLLISQSSALPHPCTGWTLAPLVAFAAQLHLQNFGVRITELLLPFVLRHFLGAAENLRAAFCAGRRNLEPCGVRQQCPARIWLQMNPNLWCTELSVWEEVRQEGTAGHQHEETEKQHSTSRGFSIFPTGTLFPTSVLALRLLENAEFLKASF